jgi:glycosyltransferase involved in cell wall biosynthesis
MVRELGIGGCERDLTKIAKRLDRSGFAPHVGCFREQGFRSEELRNAGVPIVRFPVTSFRSLTFVKGLFAFRRYVHAHGIRLLHAFDTPTNIFGIAAARFASLRPAIASQLWFLDTIPQQLWRLHRMSMRSADAVVVNSEAVRNQLLAQNELPSGRIHVSHNGVETEIFYPPARRAGNAPIVIGAVCALRSEKRLDLLLDAFAEARNHYPAIQLLIVGSGDLLSALEQQRDRLALGPSCVFRPATKEVADCMRAIDIFVLSSESESFPNALLEAMACGCCVIASNVGGIPELIVPGESGLLFRSGDSADLVLQLMRALDDFVLRQQLSQNAAARARDHFSIEQTVARMERLYTSLIEQRNP